MKNNEKLLVISAWRNEELIAPFFFKHYHDIGVNDVHIVLDSTTNDNTIKHIMDWAPKFENLWIHKIVYSNGFCDNAKIDSINNIYHCLKGNNSGWVIVCDADEFVFSEGYLNCSESVLDTLNRFSDEGHTIINSNMYHPFRNVVDKDLDINMDKKVILQRKFGTKVPPSTNKIPVVGEAYRKPMLAKTEQNIKWSVGHHVMFDTQGNRLHIPHEIMGVHWKYADPTFVEYASKNRLNNFDYIRNNFNRGMGHHWVETLDEAYQKCEEYSNGEQLF